MDVKSYFAEYPLSQEVHETSDGLLFHQSQDAINHSRSLEDQRVKAHYRKTEPKTAEVPGADGSEFEQHPQTDNVSEDADATEDQDTAAISEQVAKKVAAKKATKKQ